MRIRTTEFRIQKLLGVAASVLLLAACGGSSAPASPASPTTASAAAKPSAAAESLDAVKTAAAKEGKLLWYDTITQEQGDQIIKQFQQAYPAIKDAKFLEVTSGNRAARITQESRAGGPTTDVDFENAATTAAYYKDGFVMDVDWKGLGVQGPPQMTPTSYMVAITAAFRGMLYNTQKVSEADAPKTYEDLIDPKWMNRIGLWARAAAYTGLRKHGARTGW